MHRLALVLPESFVAGGIAGTADLFDMANRLGGGERALFSWRLLSADGRPARAANGMTFPVDGSYRDADEAGVIFIPGINYLDLARFEARLAAETALAEHLRCWRDEGRLIAGNCTGVALLAQSGILDGHTATTCWWLSSWFRRRFPAIRLDTNAIVAESGRLLCSGATTSYLNLGLRLIDRLAGPDVAQACARLMLVDTQRTSQAPYATLQQYLGHNDSLVTRSQEWLQTQLAAPFSLAALAAATGSSERTLIRRFKTALGETPLRYVQLMRLYTARRLLETSALGFEQIVARVGYEDVSAFRRLFKRELGCAPGEYRRRFASPAKGHWARQD